MSSTADRSILSSFAILMSAFALLLVVVVAARDDDVSSGSSAGGAGPVAVQLSEFAITPASLSVPEAGRCS